jgi:hypothetical protein
VLVATKDTLQNNITAAATMDTATMTLCSNTLQNEITAAATMLQLP